jgi:large subunit ribosomal protein L4
LYKGGGTIFGPKPRGYDFKLNRKVKDLAKISALSYKAKAKSIIVVEDLEFKQPKTSEMISVLDGLKLTGKKALFVIPEYNDNLHLSLRNIPNIESSQLADVNTYDIVNAEFLVLTESAAKMFMEEEEVATA